MTSRHPSKQREPGSLSSFNDLTAQISHVHRPLKISKSRSELLVIVPTPKRRWEYVPFRASTTVNSILKEFIDRDGKKRYKIEYDDGTKEDVLFVKLMSLKNGPKSLHAYNSQKRLLKSLIADSTSTKFNSRNLATKAKKRNRELDDLIKSTNIDPGPEEDSDDIISNLTKKRRLRNNLQESIDRRSNRSGKSASKTDNVLSIKEIKDSENDSDEDIHSSRSVGHSSSRKRFRSPSHLSSPDNLRSSHKEMSLMPHRSDDESDELGHVEQKNDSKITYLHLNTRARYTSLHKQNNKSEKHIRSIPKKHRNFESSESSESTHSLELPSRRSSRKRISKNMKEYDEDKEVDSFEDSSNTTSRVIKTKETFLLVAKHDLFRQVHNKFCNVCKSVEKRSTKGLNPLINCQGCSFSFHKNCLGNCSSRDHLVTKIDHDSFVLQCRYCIGIATKKDKNSPRIDLCATCRQIGLSCVPFSVKKTPRQEEKIRLENNGIDPVTETPIQLVNNAENVLFRCISCKRAYHFEHLPPLKCNSKTSIDEEKLRQIRLEEYSEKWCCKDCQDAPARVGGLVCWRPLNRDHYEYGLNADEVCENDKEYLIKWLNKSYFECTWMPGNWVYGVTQKSMRKAFLRRDEGSNMFPKWNFEEAVPEEFLRIEIVFDVHYDRNFCPESEKVDKAAINMISEIFVKFEGLSYDDAVWMKPPTTEKIERFRCFKTAYSEYIAGKYFRQSSHSVMEQRLAVFRGLNFSKHIEMKEQPVQLIGGQMMSYQLEGLNWLLYNFYQKKNVILADEMGLGKTIQVIGFFVAIVKMNPKCWPFLVVTPNSTCTNWRREIKKWAPALRVVSYFGPKNAREISFNYEMYPGGCSDLRAHIVITSFDAPIDDFSRTWFCRVKWMGLVVDEGQRLKNDQNLLYTVLKAMKIPFQVLLTGTPLQNNKRELFNLLQFLDTNIDAAKLDEQFDEITKNNLTELHKLIRPFFLRRTKLQVLNFLPPVSQIIIPVTMSIVQKKLYKSILSKNPDLIRSVFSKQNPTLKQSERGNLNNILMQLRKCLCHPFLYSSAIEDRSFDDDAIFRNLVDASAKFQLLEILLPKLHQQDHRVLIFSQFLNYLDLIEDFLTSLNLSFQRLDGKINSVEKQKRIDAFNAPDSPLFAFLLSTRAGGVGINLATADTVLIMPHQDIQALSRAHRIGQEKKVLVFQLMTKDSVEEKIIQIGRKKLALDKALIGKMDAKTNSDFDLESILRFGADALFNGNDHNDIHYDSASVEKLLDRSFIEGVKDDQETIADSHFSLARIWANDRDCFTEYNDAANPPKSPPQFSAWDKILAQREVDAALEALESTQALGRGKRSRQENEDLELEDDLFTSPINEDKSYRKHESDNDFDPTEEVKLHGEEEIKNSDYDLDEIDRMDSKEQDIRVETLHKETETYSTGPSEIQQLFSNPSMDISQEHIQQSAIYAQDTQYPASQLVKIHPHQSQMISYQYTPHESSSINALENGGITQLNSPTLYFLQQIVDIRNRSYDSSLSSPSLNNVSPFQQEKPSLIYIDDTMKCSHCGIAHFQLSKTCPSQASVIQLRFMLDKIVRQESTLQQHITENILRKYLFITSQAKRKKVKNLVEV